MSRLGIDITLTLFIWAIALVVAITSKHESVTILAELPWWHRLLGGIAAVTFYGPHLWPLIHGLMPQ